MNNKLKGTIRLYSAIFLLFTFAYLLPVNIKAAVATFIQWSTEANNLSQARYRLSATSVGTKVIFAGGMFGPSGGFSYTNKVDIFDTSTNTWTQAGLSQERADLAATTVGDLAIFAGGIYFVYGLGDLPTSTVDIYDNTTNIWSRASLSLARSRLAATSTDGKAFFAGGMAWTGASNKVDIYDSATKTWSTAFLSQARWNLAATSVCSKAFFAGGDNGSQGSAVVDIFDSSTGSWTTVTLSKPRTGLAATSVGNKALFAGGGAEVDIYDCTTNTWSTATLSQSRSNMAATSIDGKALFAGGYFSATTWPYYSDVVDVYDENTNTWYTNSLSQNRGWLAATSNGDRAFFGGGLGIDGIQKFISSVEIAKIVNSFPSANSGPDLFVDENDTVIFDGSRSIDPDGQQDIISYYWNFGDGTFGNNAIVAHIYTDNGVYTATLTVTDTAGATSTDTATITINNVAPAVGTITAPLDPQWVGTSVNVNTIFTDPGVLDTHTAVLDWGDGTTSEGVVSETNGSGTVTGSHIYIVAGVYTLTLTVADKDGGIGQSSFRYIVIYDPEGGFVTGGGWINSPKGAYTVDPNLTGKVNFGFVSKYQQGTSVPSGNTSFIFSVADFKFQSTVYDWLVIAGPKAQYKGSGKVNEAGDYGFLLTVNDGQVNGGEEIDRFRIKIWNKTTGEIVYDNQLGEDDSANASTAIGSGSIVIHKD